jgi:hypothetical protein
MGYRRVGVMTLDEAEQHIGAGVVYRPFEGRAEDVVITSVNEHYVFVRYAGDQSSKATNPADLELLMLGAP